jgi:catechol 2,3-dioxygenase-like lactoylglutathione lyase family enzyme
VTARLDHHVGLRTADIEAATRFWVAALDGEEATPPALRTGGYFDQLFGEGAQVKVNYVVFDKGAVELFEFVEPRVEVPPSSQTSDGVMHFGVTVDDVPAVLAKVEAAGGKRRLDMQRVGGREDAPRFVYCEDPEGHVFELMEMTRDETVAQIKITLARMAEAEKAQAS